MSSRKALVVGIDYYEHVSSMLQGCVNDAHAVKTNLERHGDGSVNFDVKLLTGTGPSQMVLRQEFREAIENLFSDDNEIALLFFAGHGYMDSTGGYLLTTDSKSGDDGVSLANIVTWANKSRVKNKIIILDSCHSGIAADIPTTSFAELSEGMTILTASTASQYALEGDGGGVFTSLLIDALNGSAANLVGDITPGSVYAHIDQSLGAWDQRPVFKTNVKSFVSLRSVPPPISLEHLRRIVDFFPDRGSQFLLDPTFEPETNHRDPALPLPIAENTEKFAVLQKFNRVNLVVPVDAPHMYYAAIENKSCKLTVLGEHYRRLVKEGKI